MTRQPNIVWITTHDINPHLGAYAGVYPGAEYAVTPRLDRLAAEGVRFDQAFAAAPICAPSRSAIITGCFPTAIGTMHMRTKAAPPPEVRLLPEYFREAGYYVTNASFTDFQTPTPVSVFDDCSDGAHWRNRPDPDQPFFAAFQGLMTHESQIYLDDEAFAERTRHVADADRHEPDRAPLPPYYPDTETFRKSWARYNDLITEMDHWAGGILDQLGEDGVADNTIVVFWSDHGLGMPRGKRWINDSGLHEPLLVRWPGRIEPGTSTDALVHLMDLAPSMLAAAGIPVPEHMHAKAFLDEEGLVDGGNTYLYAGRDRMGELEDMSRSVPDQRFRYIRRFHPDRSPMQHCNYPDRLWTWSEMRRMGVDRGGPACEGRATKCPHPAPAPTHRPDEAVRRALRHGRRPS
ncbi:sulfatase [Streptomyces sp. NBC_00120]|uniref:sulfatase family protein n=1 Tax=Streptomyces sp. NBC_00120 TaxID=2975660 RepID=UPI002252726A|nr:sulfatase [Streptomyces sp. NBC_00120]MCX5320011.1 sulfatase [Streptomyces sp. NBC_00120]